MTVSRAFSRLPRAFWWSLLVYAGVTIWQGRDALGALCTAVIHDIGDPLLNAAILAWNARNVPWTQDWWNMPMFAPTPDALTFSEHLLGLTPISTPLYWLTGSGLAAYNLTTLLTFPLCGAAMFLLMFALTENGAASFLAGLAFAFAPYRVSHLPHIQILAVFWMPLTLLGLHRYVATGAPRWLLLSGAAWFLQGASNGYYLVFFSVLVGLWAIWFVVATRRWPALWRIAATLVVAALPLVPILARYAAVHRTYGFTRSEAEIEFYSADVAAVLCAPNLLELWSWLRVGCKFEGELFPGITVVLVCVLAILFLARSGMTLPAARLARIAVQAACVVAALYLATALSVWWWGRWRFDLGPLAIRASSFMKPFSVALWAGAIGLALTARFGRVAAAPAAWFYGASAIVTWMLALGPTPRLFQDRAFDIAPYSWLMALPGADSLRVPARFWMVTVLCLAILMGLLVSRVFARVGRAATLALTVAIAAGILLDSWTRVPVVDGPDMLWAERFANSTVLELPIGEVDTAAPFRAIEGGWRTVNGYSGYRPPSYDVLRAAAREEDSSVLEYLGSSGSLNVTVAKDARRLVEMMERDARARPVAESRGRLLYIVPQRSPAERAGTRVAVVGATASCGAALAPVAIDGQIDLAWDCGPQLRDEQLVLDLGRMQTIGAIRHVGGQRPADHPRRLVIETSEDGATWEQAWAGGVAGLVFRASVTTPEHVAIVLPFQPRSARYVSLRQIGRDPRAVWAVSEVEVFER